MPLPWIGSSVAGTEPDRQTGKSLDSLELRRRALRKTPANGRAGRCDLPGRFFTMDTDSSATIEGLAVETMRAASTLAHPPRARTLVLSITGGKPPDEELRRLIAEDVIPDATSAEDAIGGTIIDNRYFAAMPGLRGRIARHMPLLLAEIAEVLFRGKDYDAVLTWSEKPSIVMAAVMRFCRRRPATVAILFWPSRPKKAVPLRLVKNGIDRFLVCSPLQRRFVQDGLGIPPGRFIDVRASVDTKFWRPIGEATDMICCVGQEMRDHGTLLEALRPLDIPCHLATGTGIFGTTSNRWWKATVGTQPLPPHVSIGRKSHAELRELYARSRFVVVPLIPSDSDNGITTILEAFAMGKPVIATETAGQVGVLEDGVNCIRVPPFDAEALRAAITELWSDPERCRRLGAAGRELVVQQHGIDQWTGALVRAVAEAVATRAATGRTRRS
jgi:glycosyltransferase involved in cell wall biosynthesis